MDYKTLITNEIKKLKNANSNTTPDRLFEKACENLKYQILKYFREDISMIFLFSCQIILNGRFMINGKGKTKEEAYNNAIRSFLENIEENYFIDEINENIKNFDNCECLISFCKEFFEKYPTKISKMYRNNIETIKNELRNRSKPLIITESYNNINEDKTICSIYLNNELLLHQSCGKDNKEAFENAAKEFFISYSIIRDQNNAENTKKTEFNLADVLSQLRNHLNADNVNKNYFDEIKKFVQNLNYKFEVKFYNEIATAKINGVKVAEAKEKDEYSSYISLCHSLLKKIRQAKPYVRPPVEPIQQFTRSSSVDCLGFYPKTKITNQFLSQMEHQKSHSIMYILVKPDKPKNIPVKNPLDLTKKYQEIARAAKLEHNANETLDYWSIVNRHFLRENIPIEPKYDTHDNNCSCILISKGFELAEGFDTSGKLAREKAAKEYILKYL